jgi:hypothetical protein
MEVGPVDGHAPTVATHPGGANQKSFRGRALASALGDEITIESAVCT